MTLFLIYALGLVAVSTASTCQFLKFENSDDAFVKLTPDFSTGTSAFSLCVWSKKLVAGNYKTLVNYKAPSPGHRNEILLTDNLSWDYLMGSYNGGAVSNMATGYWTHLCLTWSRESGESRSYMNGTLRATKTAPNRAFSASGEFYIGKYHDSNHLFGGELTKLEVFPEELSQDVITRMFTLGPCSGVLKLDQSAHPVMLGWDDILTSTLPKSVTVQEMAFKNVIRSGVTVWDLLLGQTISDEMIADQQYILDTMKNLIDFNLTQTLVDHLREDEQEQESQSEEGSWAILADYKGNVITDGLLKQLNQNHPED